MIDVQVYLGRWPFRRLPLDEPAALVTKLRALGVERAWAGSLDALLHEDVGAVNARLAEDCRRFGRGMLVPFGMVNPRLPDWREDLRRVHEVHEMPGIRLHPNYHGYALDDPELAALLDETSRRGLLLQVARKLEDERTQHPMLRVPPVDLGPLPALLTRFPKLRVVLLNALFDLHGESLTHLLDAGDVAVDFAMLEGVGGLESLIPAVGLERVLFASLAPLFVPESAVLKLKESALTPEQREAIVRGNARRRLP